MSNTITAPAVNPSVEAWLNSFGVNYKLASIPLADIDVKSSHANQARINPLQDDIVERYAIAAEAGAIFPPIVVRKTGNRHIVIDGNHRVAVAMLRDEPAVSAYVVTCTATVATTMAVAANATNGERNTPEEQRQHIMQLFNYGLTREQVAQTLGISFTIVRNTIQAMKARRRGSNPKSVDKLSDTVLIRLNAIHSDVVFNDAVNAAAAHRMSSAAVGDMVKAIDKSAAEAVQLGQIANFIADAGSALKPRPKGARRDDLAKLKMAIGSFMAVDPVAVGLMANGDAEELKSKLAEVAAKLPTLVEAL